MMTLFPASWSQNASPLLAGERRLAWRKYVTASCFFRFVTASIQIENVSKSEWSDLI